MRGIQKFFISILVGLIVTLISGIFPSPLSYVLLGVALRGLPFAWISQVIYPGAPAKIEYDGFMLDVFFWALVFYVCYYRVYKGRQVSPRLNSQNFSFNLRDA